MSSIAPASASAANTDASEESTFSASEFKRANKPPAMGGTAGYTYRPALLLHLPPCEGFQPPAHRFRSRQFRQPTTVLHPAKPSATSRAAGSCPATSSCRSLSLSMCTASSPGSSSLPIAGRLRGFSPISGRLSPCCFPGGPRTALRLHVRYKFSFPMCCSGVVQYPALLSRCSSSAGCRAVAIPSGAQPRKSSSHRVRVRCSCAALPSSSKSVQRLNSKPGIGDELAKVFSALTSRAF